MKSNTRAGKLKLFEQVEITLPANLTIPPEDEPFFRSIICTRPNSEWSDVSIFFAAVLATAQRQILEETEKLMQEGSVVVNERGTQIPNPRHSVIETLVRRATHLAKTVHVDADATIGRRRDNSGKVAAQRKAKAIDEQLNGGLIK